MNGWKKIVLPIVVALVAIIFVSIYYVSTFNPPPNVTLREKCYRPEILSSNQEEKVFFDNKCYLHVESNHSYTILEVGLREKVIDGSIDIKVSTFEPVSIIFEYAPMGVNATGSRLILPLKKGEYNVHIAIKNGGVYSVYADEKVFGKEISPYILEGGEKYSRLKITMWSPWGINLKFFFKTKTKH